MFKNEYRPPQNLWIERGFYNNDNIDDAPEMIVVDQEEIDNLILDEVSPYDDKINKKKKNKD